jgi:hypothetical protein
MPKYRKKPVIIEAMRYLSSNAEDVAAWCSGSIRGTKLHSSERELAIQTLEGEMRAIIGDYIIKGIKGEFYPCKSDIFELTYEEIKE